MLCARATACAPPPPPAPRLPRHVPTRAAGVTTRPARLPKPSRGAAPGSGASAGSLRERIARKGPKKVVRILFLVPCGCTKLGQERRLCCEGRGPSAGGARALGRLWGPACSCSLAWLPSSSLCRALTAAGRKPLVLCRVLRSLKG